MALLSIILTVARLMFRCGASRGARCIHRASATCFLRAPTSCVNMASGPLLQVDVATSRSQLTVGPAESPKRQRHASEPCSLPQPRVTSWRSAGAIDKLLPDLFQQPTYTYIHIHIRTPSHAMLEDSENGMVILSPEHTTLEVWAALISRCRATACAVRGWSPVHIQTSRPRLFSSCTSEVEQQGGLPKGPKYPQIGPSEFGMTTGVHKQGKPRT